MNKLVRHRGYIDLPTLQTFDVNMDLHLGNVHAYASPVVSEVSAHANTNVMFGIRFLIFPRRHMIGAYGCVCKSSWGLSLRERIDAHLL